MIAVVHMPAAVSVPLAAAGLLAGAWYWLRLGRAGVAPARRRIRRTSLLIGAVGLVAAVRGLSFVDPNAAGVQYVLLWMVVLAAAAGLVVTAILDAACSLRAIERESEQTLTVAARRLREAVEAARRRAAEEGPADDGDEAGGETSA